ncbi:MAG TPA: hypothetical protein VEJ87_12820 [Acidimicrobiales bacterium]|nr:hypothetical protein [Acidimicrobiales bacterium]
MPEGTLRSRFHENADAPFRLTAIGKVCGQDKATFDEDFGGW